jgi:acetylcholinesterase
MSNSSNPTPLAGHKLPFKWSPVQPIPENAENFDIDMLNIDDHSEMVKNPDKSRMDFWRSVFKTWNGGLLKAKL